MDVGIIGAGRLGTALAVVFTRAGHKVMVSGTRGPRALAPLVDELGTNASAGTPQEAADFGDVVVLAVPWDQKENAAASVPFWQGRTVLVPVNPLRDTAAGLEVVDTGGIPPTEIVAGLLPGALVVKGFNTYLAQALPKEPDIDNGRRIVLLAGDDSDAKRRVADLADSAGFQAVDTGTLAEGAPLFDTGGPLSGLGRDLLAL
ncbi:NAD(P)-binding domain-containing protein [Streptomyces sp. NPDC048659]|uniref:NADPH-dependent F420 reductase n=1 Tax=Streptomyces sp. NPDC048659 TaxID=3155489 RepID=UPI00341E810C